MNGLDLPFDFYREPNEDYVVGEVKKIIAMFGSFCRVLKIDRSKVEINIPALKDVVIRIDERKLYFHIYHNQMQPNECKILALFVYWILKLRPFCLHCGKHENTDFSTQLNEKFCAYVFMQILCRINPQKCLDIASNGYLKELAYSFRFRDLSKEALYLTFDSCVMN